MSKGLRDLSSEEFGQISKLAKPAFPDLASGTVLTREQMALLWGGSNAKPLTPNQVEIAIETLRSGHDVSVESLQQMRQIQAKLEQLGVRSESNSTLIPQRPAKSIFGGDVKEEIAGSFRDGRGTFRVDPPHPHEPGTPYNPHNVFVHINITLPNGKTLAILVTGSKKLGIDK